MWDEKRGIGESQGRRNEDNCLCAVCCVLQSTVTSQRRSNKHRPGQLLNIITSQIATSNYNQLSNSFNESCRIGNF
jgi:hypothetical protein